MRRLQEFGFEQSPYERPNQTWVCGRARDGQCCLAGPDAHGHCTASTECRPLRKGDHWQCTRPPSLGGPCAEGPSPHGLCCRVIPKCNPVRSLRSWRGITVLLTVAATLGSLLLALGWTHGDRVFSPGPLSFSHSFMSNDCSQCHGRLPGRTAQWLAAGSDSHAADENSGLCMHCHIVGEAPLRPHSLAPSRLQPMTLASLKKRDAAKRPAGLALASFILGAGQSDGRDVACAACHQEHRGAAANLTKLSNSQCQSCHAAQFASLAEGHPPFTRYPFYRRTRIIFDHESHRDAHFKDAAFAKFAPRSCVDCHQTDLRGGTMLVKPFEAVCANCHDTGIKKIAADIPFLSIPPMDDQKLTGDYSIGQWPDPDSCQSLTPFLRLLLWGDPLLRQAMDDLRGLDLSNLPKNDAGKLKAAQTLAWGIKSLLFDLGANGQEELIRRLNLGLRRPLADPEKEGVAAFLGGDTLRATFGSAFPNLQKEVLDYRNNAKSAKTQILPPPELASPGPVKVASPDSWVSQGGWYSRDGLFALNYHPRGHRDRFLSSWLDITADAGRALDLADSEALFKSLSAPQSVGLCSKCHSIDAGPGKRVNWVASRPDPLEHSFNRFSHAAHLSLLDTRGCETCHAITATASKGKETYASAFAPGKSDPSDFRSNFGTIDKAVCASCHRPSLVRDDCLLCHNYHIGRFKPVIAHANMISVSP